MTSFVDAQLPPRIKGYPTTSSPRFSTSIQASASGAEQRNQNWVNPLQKIDLPDAVRSQTDLEALKDHWYRMRGPKSSWPCRDPVDFASIPLRHPNTAPQITRADVIIGVGDGITRIWPLFKPYALGTAEEYKRPIILPVLDTVVIGIDGIAPPDVTGPNGGPYSFTVSRPGGVITFDHAPQVGDVVTAGFLFDVPVRFEADDSLAAVVKTFGAGGFGSFSLLEVRPCGVF